MKFPKFLTKSKNANTDPAPPESELCGMMREAIDATAAGSSPWHLKETTEIIDTVPLTKEERATLRDHLEMVMCDVQRDIMKRKLTEVLTGATVLRPGTILNDVKRMGEPHTEPPKVKVFPQDPSPQDKDAYLRQVQAELQKQAYENNMRNIYAAQSSSMQQMQNAQSTYDIPYEKRKL